MRKGEYQCRRDEPPRQQVEALIAAHGGKATGSVSKKTTYVLAGSEPGGNKISDAARLGIPVIDEAAFDALLANAGAAQ